MEFFQLYELVDKNTYVVQGENAWKLFNPLALQALDNLRQYFGRPITVNNWHSGGRFQYRGFRPLDCPIGSKLSQHKLGNAFDCDVEGYTAEEVRWIVLNNKDHELFKLIQRIEDEVSWFHFDLKEVKDRIKVFKV